MINAKCSQYREELQTLEAVMMKLIYNMSST